MESVKATAVESADKALDALLSQVQVMKEVSHPLRYSWVLRRETLLTGDFLGLQKLAQHKAVVERTVPSTPQSEAGDYKLV